MNTARVNKKGADRVRQGHLWIYRSDVIAVDAEGGAVVVVRDDSVMNSGPIHERELSQLLEKEVVHRWRSVE